MHRNVMQIYDMSILLFHFQLLPNIDFNKFLDEYGTKAPEYQFQR